MPFVSDKDELGSGQSFDNNNKNDSELLMSEWTKKLELLHSINQKSSITVRFSIPVTDKVEVNLFDMHGRCIKTLYNDIKNAGTFSINCDKKVFASGAHIFQLKTSGSGVLLYEKVMIIK